MSCELDATSRIPSKPSSTSLPERKIHFCKSFVYHSYENSRGVYQQFPFWNSRFVILKKSPLFLFMHLQIAHFTSPCFDIHASDGGGVPPRFFQLSTLNFRMGESHA